MKILLINGTAFIDEKFQKRDILIEDGKAKGVIVQDARDKEAEEEIARIASGDVTDISLEHAKELRNSKKVA